MFNDKAILITGGTGSFGKQCVETLLNHHQPKKSSFTPEMNLSNMKWRKNLTLQLCATSSEMSGMNSV